MKEDLSDWAPKQAHPDALLAELIGEAPLFDADALGWRSRLKLAGRNAGCIYRGDIHNMSLALEFEPRLKGRFAWNAFRHRVEVVRKTPWCNADWWETANLTPVGHRALRDADMTELGNYLTGTYDFGDCAMPAMPRGDPCRGRRSYLRRAEGLDRRPAGLGRRGAPRRLARDLCRRRHRRRTRRNTWRWSARNTSCRCSTGRSTQAPRPTTRWSSPPARDRQGPGAGDDVRALLPRGHSVATGQPGRLCPRHRRGHRRARRRDVGLEQVRRRGAEGGADALRRPWPAGLWLRGALLSTPHLPRLHAPTTSTSCRMRPATGATGASP